MTESKIVLFSSLNAAEVFLVRSLLTREGIESEIRRSFLAPLAGEIPMDDARVELMVARSQLERASAVLDQAKNATGPDRVCLRCGEISPASFEICWSCGAELEEHDD